LLISGDGLTTPLDALWVINAINQSTPAAALPAADLNSDNQIDLADADLAIGLVAAAHQENLARELKGQSIFQKGAQSPWRCYLFFG
jgi:hypothetical protein